MHVDDTIAARFRAGHILHREHGTRARFIGLDHLLQHGGTPLRLVLAHHQVVGQQHCERLVSDQTLGAEHRMPQAQSPRLAHVNAIHVVGLDGMHQLQQRALASGFELHLQFVGRVEVVFDRALVAAGYKDHFANTRRVGLLNRVLDQRFVHHGQHFLGNGLGSGQKAGAQATHREHGFSNRRHVCTISRTAKVKQPP